jgi:hypothetical protein
MPTIITAWHQFHGPLIAFAVTLGLALAGRFLGVELLAMAAGGAGVIAGWYALTGHLWTIPPPSSVDLLAEFAALALLISLLLLWFGQDRHSLAGQLVAALAAGWLLSGAPRHPGTLQANWPIFLGSAIAVLLFARLLADRAVDPMRLALAALTLAAALHVAGTPPIWAQLALVPGLAALAMFVLPALSGLAALPVAVDVAGLACLAVLALGRLRRLGFSAADAAALAPLLSIWLLPHAVGRIRRLGRAAPLAGSLLAGAISVGCVWLAWRVLRR